MDFIRRGFILMRAWCDPNTFEINFPKVMMGRPLELVALELVVVPGCLIANRERVDQSGANGLAQEFRFMPPDPFPASSSARFHQRDSFHERRKIGHFGDRVRFQPKQTPDVLL
ncbi:hypothetical protein K227x_14170 [Rubripirellula lacrimiformis]|uniref:Uncharacterized protein n=1 Tax=Rubripirellula lacrimiformis TaxID=1930273 RepID=A0A517N7R2_9BACT|nr:hypothetical protein K227x_14170 [Rubripirellula lacrimiformis]